VRKLILWLKDGELYRTYNNRMEIGQRTISSIDTFEEGYFLTKEELEAERRKAFEAGRARTVGNLYYDPNSGYGATDPEMRGCRFGDDIIMYETFKDYKKTLEGK
jgi:hypothetical protein